MKYITMAKIGSPHGIKGYFKLFSYTQPAAKIFEYSPLAITRDILEEQVELDTEKVFSNIQIKLVSEKPGKFLIVKSPEINTREVAESYTNALLLGKSEKLDDLGEDEYYWHQLIGAQVCNEDGVVLGKVQRLSDTGANEVIEVYDEQTKNTFYIPWILNTYILNVDLQQQKIQVHWLLDY